MERESFKRVLDSGLTVLIPIYLALGTFVFITSVYSNYGKLEENLVGVVLLSTSIVAATFLFVRVYIDDQLSLMEVKMGREFKQDIKDIMNEFAEKQRKEFAEQRKEFAEQKKEFAEQKKEFAEQSARFDKQDAMIEQILEIYKKQQNNQ